MLIALWNLIVFAGFTLIIVNSVIEFIKELAISDSIGNKDGAYLALFSIEFVHANAFIREFCF